MTPPNVISLTEGLAEFVASPMTSSSIPGEALELVRRAFTDTVGVSLAAGGTPQAQRIIDYVARYQAEPRCAVWGSQVRTSAELAGLANGVLAHSLDFDDTNHPMYGHPSCTLVPTVLALAEEANANYGVALRAYIVGFEVDVALSRGLNMGHYAAGFHATGTIGTVGASAAAACLMSLDVAATRNALGIAASLASGLRVNVGTSTKPLHAGMASQAGIQAARLASLGWDSHEDALGSRFGFTEAYSGDHDSFRDWGEVIEKLTNRWSILEPHGLAVKPFPSCGATHPSIQAAIEIHRELLAGSSESWGSFSIAHVRLGVTDLLPKILVYHAPRTGTEARFSLEYTVAVALLRGDVGIDDFAEARVHDSEVQSLMQRIEVVVDDRHRNNTEFAATVRVEFDHRDALERTVYLAKGKNENPMSDADFRGKLARCVGEERDVNELWKLLMESEEGRATGEIVSGIQAVAR